MTNTTRAKPSSSASATRSVPTSWSNMPMRRLVSSGRARLAAHRLHHQLPNPVQPDQAHDGETDQNRAQHGGAAARGNGFSRRSQRHPPAAVDVGKLAVLHRPGQNLGAEGHGNDKE